ncbi:MAG: cobalamin-dependent protein [Acidobacteriota bacterium]|nr:MAG: cobalamin-dependent protein [Acidobacteriota bacterium]
MQKLPKILLTSVFGPYGVDDAYGRKENIMELFHNQVTREQGLFSLRFQHQSFGLYLIADNLQADTTVLDFPSQKRFIQEIQKGYDYIGISFITPNFVKAKRMAELVRQHAPHTTLVLGGHGTAIPDIEKLIEHDHICRGEGVGFFRKLLGEKACRPISHPIMPSSFNQHIMGIPMPNRSAVLMTGVGCVNACRFCCTSHFFDRKYTAFFSTGKQIFDFCERAERERGYTEFFIMDENFLKNRERAEELVDEMERHGKSYRFSIFSSAETIREVGIDFVSRLGVTFLWLGMEGRRSESDYEKNRGVNFPELVAELRSAGVVVLGSVILFTEQHDKETIHDEIDFAIDAAPDFIQFMQLGPLPTTKLYQSYKIRGLLREDVPYEEWHGQHQLWFRHPHFTPEESEVYLRNAFRRAWDELGSSLLRLFETNLLGYLSTRGSTDPLLVARHEYFKACCLNYFPGLRVLIQFAHNPAERRYAEDVFARYEEEFGSLTLASRALSWRALLLAAIEKVRIATVGNLRQPRTLVTRVAYTPARSESLVPSVLDIQGLPWTGRLSLKSEEA